MASAHSEAAKMEQIVTEFFTKTLQIIAESRSACVSSRNFSGGLSSPSSTSSSSSSNVRPRDKWFNLALRECPAALESSDLLCRDSHEPMVVDVVLVQSMPEAKSERVLERWVVHHETGTKKKDSSANSNRIRSSSNSNLYKKTILLLRSLYVTVRLLPAYKIYHGLNSSSWISPFAIVHRVSSLAEPFSRGEEAEMQRFAFTPVDTPAGRLCISVSYNPSLSDISSSESSIPLSSRVITDYVGSPLADPLKRFSSSPFTRRHSWGFDIYSTSSPLTSFSPSPTRSEPHQRPLEPPCLDKKDPGFDECFPSLIFALSPSPSRPICIPGTHLPNSLMRSESAPVRIPAPRFTYNNNNNYSNNKNNSSAALKQDLPPSSPLKTLRSCTSFKSDKSTGVSHIGSQNSKLCCVRKEDGKQCSGPKLSSNTSISRSSSMSIPGDFEESDFACPFDVDGNDITDPGSRPESFEQRGAHDPIGLLSTKSRDAAVGELVLLLKKAQPLHQDLSKSAASTPETISEPDKHAVMGSGLVAPKTTAEAFEELQGYRDLKNLLVARGSKSTRV